MKQTPTFFKPASSEFIEIDAKTYGWENIKNDLKQYCKNLDYDLDTKHITNIVCVLNKNKEEIIVTCSVTLELTLDKHEFEIFKQLCSQQQRENLTNNKTNEKALLGYLGINEETQSSAIMFFSKPLCAAILDSYERNQAPQQLSCSFISSEDNIA